MNVAVFFLDISSFCYLHSRPVHGSGRVGFVPNPDLTHRCRVEGRGTQNRPLEKSIESILGKGECWLVRSISKIKNFKKKEKEKEKRSPNSIKVAEIWKKLLESTFFWLESTFFR